MNGNFNMLVATRKEEGSLRDVLLKKNLLLDI